MPAAVLSSAQYLSVLSTTAVKMKGNQILLIFFSAECVFHFVFNLYLFFKDLILFIFGCVGSLLLHVGFL